MINLQNKVYGYL